jgi:hypothetical protein
MRYWFPFTEEAVQQVRPYTLDQMWPFYNKNWTGYWTGVTFGSWFNWFKQ